MKTETISTVRDNFGETVSRVAYGGDRVVITRRGKPMAALISSEDFELFNRLREDAEDRLDASLAVEAREEHEKSGEPYVALDDLKAEFGL